jgi:hypothetical protein
VARGPLAVRLQPEHEGGTGLTVKASGVPQRDALRGWHVALLYVALTAALAYPLVRHAASHVLSVSPDTDLLLWILSWDAHALTSHPLSIFDANIFAPLHRTLAFSENLIGSGLFAVPLLGLTHNPVLAMNLLALLSCVLCGVGAFTLARRAGAGSAGAAIGGLIFAFAPPRFLRLDQLFLATIQWMPFSLAYLHAYLDEGEHGSRFYLRLAAAFFTLQAVTSGHGAVFLALASIALFGYRLILGAPLAVTKRLRDLGITGVMLLAPIVPMAIAYVRVQRDMGLKRSLVDWVMATPTSFLASPTYVHSFVITRLLPGVHVFETATAYLFPGYVPLVLAAAALLSLMAAPRRANTIFYALLVAFCVWLSMGPPWGLWPLVYWLPGFNFIRAASRFMLLGTLALSVLAAIGFDWISRRMNPARRLAAAGVVACALVAEFAVPLDVRPYAVVIPAADRFVAHLPKPFTVAEVPLPGSTPEYEFEQRQAMFMLHSTEHWQKTVHGWSGLQPPGHLVLWDRLTRFPDEASLRSLAEFQVDYIVVHTDLYAAGEWPEIERRLTAYRDRLELRYMDGTSRVYSRTAR